MSYNASDTDWIDSGLGLSISLISLLLGAFIRFLASKVIRLDTERTLIHRRSQTHSHIIVGEYRLLSLLGAPHILRTRSTLGFITLVSIVIATTALSIASLAFSGSHTLLTGTPTAKVTAVEAGDPDQNENQLLNFADWLRSSGAVSFCQRRRGKERVYYKPYVQAAKETRVYCGERLRVSIAHEIVENIEQVQPSILSINNLNSTTASTPFSRYVVHNAIILGKGWMGVCNTGPFYRGVRSGRVSQSCAFAKKTTLILGGYTSKEVNLAGPGRDPSIEDVRYYSSYEVDIGTELRHAQLMQALTMWDLGTMSEVEVAVLATMKLQMEEGVPSFTGGFQRLQIDNILLVLGLAVGLAVPLYLLFVLLWDGFSRAPEERLQIDVLTLDGLSRIWKTEVSGQNEGHLNHLALGDNTECTCDTSQVHDSTCTHPRTYHVGSAALVRPTTDEVTTIAAQLKSHPRPDR